MYVKIFVPGIVIKNRYKSNTDKSKKKFVFKTTFKSYATLVL